MINLQYPVIDPEKERIVNSIKAWLLRFGHRDNEGFYYNTSEFDFFLSYDYELDGQKYYSQFSIRSTKGRNIDANYRDRTKHELRDMLDELNKIKRFFENE